MSVVSAMSVAALRVLCDAPCVVSVDGAWVPPHTLTTDTTDINNLIVRARGTRFHSNPAAAACTGTRPRQQVAA